MSVTPEAALILKMSSNSDKAAVGMGSLTIICLIVIVGLTIYQIVTNNRTNINNNTPPMTPEERKIEDKIRADLGKTMIGFSALFALFSFGTCVAAFAGHDQRKFLMK
jgi:hypothetical protein